MKDPTSGGLLIHRLVVAFAICFVMLAGAVPSNAQVTVVLTGTVTDRTTNAPIAGATVALYGQGIVSTTTDANGAFSFTGDQYPYTGSTEMFIHAPGYYGVTTSVDIASPFPVTFNQTLLSGGTVLKGTVLDASTNQPIANASVVYRGTNQYSAVNFNTIFVASDSNGNYAFDASDFTESAATNGTSGNLTASAGNYLQSTTSIAATPPFPVTYNLALTPGGTVLLQGTVTDRTTNAPIAGATVALYGQGIVSTTTDANGAFSFTGDQYPYTGSTEMFIHAPGYYGVTTSVDIASPFPVTFNQTLLSGGTVLKGTVLDASTNQPIANASVVYRGTNQYSAVNFNTIFVASDSNGNYAFDASDFTESAATNGTSGNLTASAGNYLQSTTSIAATPPFPVTYNLALTPGGTVLLQGTVTDRTTNAPIAGATVALYGQGIVSTTTDANGAFSFTGDQYPYTGSTEMFIHAPGYYGVTTSVDIASPFPVTFNQTLLSGGTVLKGTVLDASTNQPIANASVVYRGTNQYSAVNFNTIFVASDSNGNYAFDASDFTESAATNGTSGNLRVTSQPGYFQANISVSANPPFPATENVTMTPTGFTEAITIATDPSGLGVTVDGTAYVAPQTFNWVPGNPHTIATTSPQADSAMGYIFENWSNGGGLSQTIVTPAGNTTYTANFIMQPPITVNTASDSSTSGDGFCGLREAIHNANSAGSDTTGGDCSIGSGKDRITFSVSGSITLGSALPAVQNKLTVDGSGQTITIDGANSYQVFFVNPGATLSLNELTIADGVAPGNGGGVRSEGSLTVTNSTFTTDSTQGSGASGGAIYIDAGTALITNSTFVGNSSTRFGGGILNAASLSIENCTFSGNSSSVSGGAVMNYDPTGAHTTIANSIFVGSTSGGNCSGNITNAGDNLSDDATCGFGTSIGANDQSLGDNVNALLDPNGLQNNGGLTQTIALWSTSPAIGAIPLAQCLATDQRGDPRPAAGQDACDVGAFEGSIPAPTSTLTATSTPTPTATGTATSTSTATATPTATPTLTATATATSTPTSTASATTTATATTTNTATATATATPTATPTTSMTVTASLAFGNVAEGQSSTKTITISNTGATHPLLVSAATPSNPEYALSGTGTCGPIPITLAPRTNCTVGVSFTPNTVGSHNAMLSVSDNASTSPQHVTLTGAGIADLSLSKSSLVYGSVKFGTKTTLSFSVTNHQTQTVTLSESFSGTNASDFSITGGTCTTTLGAGKACSIVVSFAPGVLGTESATLTVSDSPDPLSPYMVALSTGPTIPETVAPLTLAYGTVSQSSSKTLKTTVTNYSPFTISIGSAVSGTNAADFTITGGTCGPSLIGNSSCTIGVKFKPTTAASETASLAVSVPQDPTSPRAVSLTGTGM